jgi:hypothetical protein
MRTRYFIRSREVAKKLAGGRVNIGFREMTAEEAEPHIRSRERKERKAAERDAGCVRP